MSSTSPSSSSSVVTSASTDSPHTSSSPFSPYFSSSPFWVGLIGVIFLAFCMVAIMKWRGVFSREFRRGFHYHLNDWSPNENVTASGWPEMFDVRMGERASDGLKWEKSMPFSVTILTDAESNRTSHAVRKGQADKNWGNSAREREEEQDAGSPRLRAAVLVAMPSPLHAQSHVDHTASGSSLRDELAIGLIEMPWIQEDHSLKRNAS